MRISGRRSTREYCTWFETKGTDKILRRAVMIGEVPGGEAGVVVREHLFDGAFGVDRTVAAGDLPHSVEDPADLQIGGDLKTAGRRHCHLRLRLLCGLKHTQGLAALLFTPQLGKRARLPRRLPLSHGWPRLRET